MDFWTWDVGRLWFAIIHLFSRDEKGRMARADITHAYVNVFVEGWRALSYLMGHILAWVVLFFIVAIPLNAISWLLVN